MIKVLYEDNHLLCIEKPVNLPVQPDSSHDLSVLDLCKSYIKETRAKKGNVFCALVHRLDRPVGGVMVLARTSKAASRISEAIRAHHMVKTYLAVSDGIPSKKEGTLIDYLHKDDRFNRVSVTDEAHGKKHFYLIVSLVYGRIRRCLPLRWERGEHIRFAYSLLHAICP